MSGFEMLLAAPVAGTALETVGNVLGAEEDGKLARANAKIVQAEAAEEARLESADGRRIAAAATVRAAKTGAVEGSALDVIAELAAEGELRARTALYKGRARYDQFRAEQQNAKKRKAVSVASGIGKIGTTILTAGMGGGEGAATSATGADRKAAMAGLYKKNAGL